ncbi:MAG: UDP-glucose/GDP-mannose dehydrogenase family protein, partial [Gammaproteobacteria bacterium]|nr:UDP-glucose/GDP-mannose dehydrogenase family protein [Gammaproteobacteria bacterium]
MKVTIYGSGYVGLVTAACLAEVGNRVVCMDIDEDKIMALRGGRIPIHEPGLDRLVLDSMEAGRIVFTSDAREAIAHGDIQFIAVGTPPDEDGTADLSYVTAVARSIGAHLDKYAVIVDKSTVPVGTADKVREVIAGELATRGSDTRFDVASNPEFLKEGSAVNDFMKPDRIIVGSDSEEAVALMRELYAPFNRNHDRVMIMDVRSAELTKYAANCMLATKISFMNEMANLAERLGADIEQVRIGMGTDPRIGYHFIYAGCGYGGSCFPKDVQALERTADDIGFEARILKAVEGVNHRQKHRLFELISQHFDGALDGRTLALWGLAFKPNTDDMREAPSRVLMEALWQAGARVQAYDPVANDEARRIYGERDDLKLCASAEEALEGADALSVVTEWSQFRSPDFDMLRESLKAPVIFDGRNLFEPKRMRDRGFVYYAIGRGAQAVR